MTVFFRVVTFLSLLVSATTSWAARYALDDVSVYFRETIAINNSGKIIGITHDNKPAILEPDSDGRYGSSAIPRTLDVSDQSSGVSVPISYNEIHLTGISNASNVKESIEVITGWYTDTQDKAHGIYWTYNGTAYDPFIVPNYDLKVKQCPAEAKTPPPFCFPVADLDKIQQTAQQNCPSLYPTTIDDTTEYPIECDTENRIQGVSELGWLVGTSVTQTGTNRPVYWVKQETDTTPPKTIYKPFDLGYNRILTNLNANLDSKNRLQGRGLLFSRGGNLIYGELVNPDSGVGEPVVWMNVGAGTYDYPIKLPRKSTRLWQAADKAFEYRSTSQNPTSPTYFSNLPVTVSDIDGTLIYGHYTDESGKVLPIEWSYTSGKTGVRIDTLTSSGTTGVFIDTDTDSTVSINWPPVSDITEKKIYDLTFMKFEVTALPTLATDGSGYIRGTKSGEVVGSSIFDGSGKTHAFLYTGDKSCGLQDINELLAPPYNTGSQELTDVMYIAGGSRPNRILAKGTVPSKSTESFFVLTPTTLQVDLETILTTDHDQMFVGQSHTFRINIRNLSELRAETTGNYATCVYVTLKDYVTIGTVTTTKVELINGQPQNVTVTEPDIKPGGLTFNKATIFHDDGSVIDPKRETCTITYIDVTCRIARINSGQSVTIVVESVARALMADRTIQTVADVAPLEKDIDSSNDQKSHSTIVKREHCFIATAAFGSYFDPNVKSLRVFRDRVLLTNPIGRRFVDWYYVHSPQWANYIVAHPQTKPFVRFLLSPLVTLITYPAATMTLLLLIFISARFKRLRLQRIANSH